MSLLPFLAVAFGAGALSLLTRQESRQSAIIGLAGLGLSMIAAAMIDSDRPLAIAGTTLAGTEFARLFLLLGALTGLLVVLVGVGASWSRTLPGALLLGLGAAGLALGLADPSVAVMAATGGGAVGLLVSTVGSAGERGRHGQARELRALVLTGALGLVAASFVSRPEAAPTLDPRLVAAAYIAFAAAVAIRLGIIPFHVWAARVADAAPVVGLPLVLAWGPATMLVVALAWTNALVAPLDRPMSLERALVVAVGATSLVLGSAAAFIHDDLEHVVGYAIVADAGIAILGLAAIDPASWEPTRTWLLAFVVSRTAFAGWAAVVQSTFGRRRLGELQGWGRRAPWLAVGLVVIAIAGLGWPGSTTWEARQEIVRLAVRGPLAGGLLAASLLPIAYYGRLFVVGLQAETLAVERTPRLRLRWPARLPRPGPPAEIAGELLAVWGSNRAALGAGIVLALGALAIAVSAGAFGVESASAALPPTPSGAPVPIETPSSVSPPPASP